MIERVRNRESEKEGEMVFFFFSAEREKQAAEEGRHPFLFPAKRGSFQASLSRWLCSEGSSASLYSATAREARAEADRGEPGTAREGRERTSDCKGEKERAFFLLFQTYRACPLHNSFSLP